MTAHKTAIHVWVSAGLALLWCGAVFAQPRELTLSAPLLPGHSNGDDTGREIEIVRETLNACGYDVRFTYDLFGQHWTRYVTLDLDGAITVPSDMSLPGFKTDSHVRFHNGVVWIADDPETTYDSVDDLAGERVVGFGDATEILPRLEEAVPTFASYEENAFQYEQIEKLYSDAADVIVADGLIAAEIVLNLRVSSDKGFTYPFDIYQPLKFKALFEPTSYHVQLRDQDVRDAFNQCLDDLRDHGRIDEINRQAIAPHRFALGSEYLGY